MKPVCYQKNKYHSFSLKLLIIPSTDHMTYFYEVSLSQKTSYKVYPTNHNYDFQMKTFSQIFSQFFFVNRIMSEY